MKDPVAEAYARGGRVAARKYGAAVARPRAREAAALPEIKTRAAARPARMSAPSMPREEAALDPRKVFPAASGARRSGSAEGDAVPVEDDGAVAAMRRGGRVRS